MDIIDRLTKAFENMFSTELIIASVISVIMFSVLYFFMINFLAENNSSTLATLFVMTMVIASAVMLFATKINSTIYLVLPVVFLVIIFALYSVEIKRIIWSKSHNKSQDERHFGNAIDNEKIQTCISEIIKALQNMSKNDIGAIIVLSFGNIPSQILDSGVRTDADISSELIESIFFPKTPLHDGAMIISGTKIVASGCFLPLSQNVDSIPKDLGTRHRAGIGITENIDVVSLIVSEETGIISIARAGKITRYADAETLKNILGQYFWQEYESSKR